MTEDQAKTKWCPFARVTTQYDRGEVYPPANRGQQFEGGKLAYSGPYGGSECLASDCMAWREKPRGLGLSEGYCGLSGRPE